MAAAVASAIVLNLRQDLCICIATILISSEILIEEIRWNLFDVVVVFVGIIEAVFDIVDRATGSDNGGVLQNVGVLRVLRVIRRLSGNYVRKDK